MKLLIVSVVLAVLQTSFSLVDEIDEDWGTPWSQPLTYGDEDLKEFKIAVADLNNKSIKLCLSRLFTRLYRGEWKNHRYIEWINKGASKIEKNINEDLTKWSSRRSFRSGLSSANSKLISYHFDCAYNWLEKRIKILKDAEEKGEQNENTSGDTKSKTIQKKLQKIKRIENIDWVSRFNMLKTKVEAARDEVAKLNEIGIDIKTIKDVLKNKKEIPDNIDQIRQLAHKIVETNQNSKVTALTSDVIDYLKEISGYSYEMEWSSNSNNDDLIDGAAVIAS